MISDIYFHTGTLRKLEVLFSLMFHFVCGESRSFFSHSEGKQTVMSSQKSGAAADIELVSATS